MNKTFSTLIASSVLAGGLAFTIPAYALPTLQLDILGGSYDSADESVFLETGGLGQLAAYCTPKNEANGNDCLSLEHFVSIAILDQNGDSVITGTDFGSFTFGGITYGNGGSPLIFGTPPLETTGGDQSSDPGDLPSHGVYETLFTEVAFNFSNTQTRDSVNVQDNPGTTFGTGNMYYELWDFNVSGLNEGWRLHFDLYNKEFGKLKGKKNPSDLDVDVDDFAPFSHDAYATKIDEPPGGNPTEIPESSYLFGLAFIGSVFKAMDHRKA